MFGKKKTEKKSTSKKQADAKKSVNKKTQKAKGGEILPLAPASKLSFATPSAASNATPLTSSTLQMKLIMTR